MNQQLAKIADRIRIHFPEEASILDKLAGRGTFAGAGGGSFVDMAIDITEPVTVTFSAFAGGGSGGDVWTPPHEDFVIVEGGLGGAGKPLNSTD